MTIRISTMKLFIKFLLIGKKKLHFFQKFFSFEVRYSLKNIKYQDAFYLKKIDLETLKKINQIIDDIEQRF